LPLSYEVDGKLQFIAPVMDEHAEWYGRVMRAAFYPEEGGDGVLTPDGFNQWFNVVQADEFIDPRALQHLKIVHDEMHARAVALLNEAAASRKPAAKTFDGFTDLYDEFIMMMRRFERDSVLEDSGMDATTGLRSRRVMRKDLEREMERRSRRGKPFSLAIVKIDRYDDIRSMQNVDDHARLLMQLANMIRKCLRSFDDAYRSGEGEFIMSLKHADITGGTSALNRLRKLLEEEKIVMRNGATTFLLTLSGCVAEPLPGDDLSILLANMRQDLLRYGEHAGTALEYHEISPLQRFVKDISEEESV
jgi:diguanylate cyclase (GGDEF)-like protein